MPCDPICALGPSVFSFPSLAFSEGYKIGLSTSAFKSLLNYTIPTTLRPSSAIGCIHHHEYYVLPLGMWQAQKEMWSYPPQKMIFLAHGLSQNSPSETLCITIFSLMSLWLEEHAWPTQEKLGCEEVNKGIILQWIRHHIWVKPNNRAVLWHTADILFRPSRAELQSPMASICSLLSPLLAFFNFLPQFSGFSLDFLKSLAKYCCTQSLFWNCILEMIMQ